MLIELQKDALIRALQHVIKAVAVNGPVPILQGIHIQAATERMIFTASNTSMTIQSVIYQDGTALNIIRKGAIVIPSRYFYEVVRKLPDGVVALETGEKRILAITSGQSHVRLCGMDSEEFPYINRGEKTHSTNKLHIHNALLKSTIKQIAIVASTSGTRPVLTGVLFEFGEAGINLTATDGVRLAYRNIHIESCINNFKAIVPARNLLELAKLLSNENETIQIEICNNRMQFIASGLKVESALIEGTFPSIKNVVPRSYSCDILVEKNSLLAAVECGTVLAGEHIISLAVQSMQLKLLSKTAEIGDVENVIPILEMHGEEFVISLNGKFLIDMIRNSDCTNIRIKYAGQTSPLVILPDDSLYTSFFLITPVRTHY